MIVNLKKVRVFLRNVSAKMTKVGPTEAKTTNLCADVSRADGSRIDVTAADGKWPIHLRPTELAFTQVCVHSTQANARSTEVILHLTKVGVYLTDISSQLRN